MAELLFATVPTPGQHQPIRPTGKRGRKERMKIGKRERIRSKVAGDSSSKREALAQNERVGKEEETLAQIPSSLGESSRGTKRKEERGKPSTCRNFITALSLSLSLSLFIAVFTLAPPCAAARHTKKFFSLCRQSCCYNYAAEEEGEGETKRNAGNARLGSDINGAGEKSLYGGGRKRRRKRAKHRSAAAGGESSFAKKNPRGEGTSAVRILFLACWQIFDASSRSFVT